MGLLNIFRRPPPIRQVGDLAQFIDEQAAFLVQKGIYEYSRARAGHYAKVLLAEQGFQAAVDESRWRAYPLGLAMVAEVVEGVLLPHARTTRAEQLDALSEVVLAIFDRYPVPAMLGPVAWAGLRDDLARRLQHIGLHPTKRAFEVPATLAETYFNLMPIHAKLRQADAPTIHNYLKVTLCNIHDTLTKRMDAPALIDALTGNRE